MSKIHLSSAVILSDILKPSKNRVYDNVLEGDYNVKITFKHERVKILVVEIDKNIKKRSKFLYEDVIKNTGQIGLFCKSIYENVFKDEKFIDSCIDKKHYNDMFGSIYYDVHCIMEKYNNKPELRWLLGKNVDGKTYPNQYILSKESLEEENLKTPTLQELKIEMLNNRNRPSIEDFKNEIEYADTWDRTYEKRKFSIDFDELYIKLFEEYLNGRIPEKRKEHEFYTILNNGVNTTSGFGLGEYLLYVKRNKQNQVIGFKFDFFQL